MTKVRTLETRHNLLAVDLIIIEVVAAQIPALVIRIGHRLEMPQQVVKHLVVKATTLTMTPTETKRRVALVFNKIINAWAVATLT